MTAPEIRPLAAAHLRDALTATTNGDAAEAVAALMNIDSQSWQAIEHRLNQLGTSLPAILTHTARTGGTP